MYETLLNGQRSRNKIYKRVKFSERITRNRAKRIRLSIEDVPSMIEKTLLVWIAAQTLYLLKEKERNGKE